MKTRTMIISGLMFLMLTTIKTANAHSEANDNPGIKFHQGSWEEALKKAKKERKPVFLDISASWCGPCKMLKSRTFPNKEVGEFYNANFINVAVDGEKGEGLTLARKYKIKGYPALIFLNSNGELIAQTAGYRNPKQFINVGKQVIGR